MEAIHDADLFRRTRLYSREVNDLLKRFDAGLHTIFEFYATGDPTKKPDDLSSLCWLMLSMDEWLQLLTDCELFKDGFTTHLSLLCFKWSQMHVTDEIKRAENSVNLTYIDFLEALARICCFTRIVSHNEDVPFKQALKWKQEETSRESLVPPLEDLISLLLSRLGQTETQLTRQELKLQLIAKQNERQKLQVLEAEKTVARLRSSSKPQGVLALILARSQQVFSFKVS